MKLNDLDEGTLILTVDGPVSASDMESLEAKTETKKPSNLLLILKKSENFEHEDFFTRLQKATKSQDSLQKLAVVTDRSWIERYGEMLSYLNAKETNTYEEGQEDEAQAWITDEETDKEEKPPVPDK